LHLIQANYYAGTVNYLPLLIADYQYQQAKLGYIQAMGQRLQDTAALFVALGGGWWNAQVGALRGSSVQDPGRTTSVQSNPQSR
jgi:outer membrane protein TolC